MLMYDKIKVDKTGWLYGYPNKEGFTMHSMKYSSIEFEVNIPETQIACELESNVVDLPQRSVKEHIEYALDNPIGAGDISTVVQKGDKVAIIISDVTRKWQAIPT